MINRSKVASIAFCEWREANASPEDDFPETVNFCLGETVSACAALFVRSVFAGDGHYLRPSPSTKAICNLRLRVRLEPLVPEVKSVRTSACIVLGRSCFDPFPSTLPRTGMSRMHP
jgi:hypothetical protein